MKALSLRQPWAHLIVNGFKDIENRKWNTKFRGRFLIHASLAWDNDLFGAEARFVMQSRGLGEFLDFQKEDLKVGGIVGEAELVDVVTKSDSPWFFGPYGFVLKNAKVLPFKPMRGKLNFFEVDK